MATGSRAEMMGGGGEGREDEGGKKKKKSKSGQGEEEGDYGKCRQVGWKSGRESSFSESEV